MPFGFTLSFAFWFGDVGPAPAKSVLDDRTEAELSAAAAAIQRKARAKKARELGYDRESLSLLEAITAAKSDRAKRLDRESLAVLEQATRGRQKREKSYKMPPKAAVHAATPQLKDKRTCHSAPFTTPTSNNSSNEISEPRNEFEAFLIREAAARAGGTKQSPFGGSNGMLRMTRSEPTTTSSDRRRQVDSVYGWFDEVERKDATDELKRLDDDLVESGGIPVPSATSQPSPLYGGKRSNAKSEKLENETEEGSDTEEVGLKSEKGTVAKEEPSDRSMGRKVEEGEDGDGWNLV